MRLDNDIVACFETELSKVLGDVNSQIMIDNVLADIKKDRDNIAVDDIPLIWKSIESPLMSLIGLSGIKVLQELLYKRFENEEIEEIRQYWGPDMAMSRME